MKRELELRRRLRSLDTLGEAVRSMKNLSAHHFRESRRGLEPMHVYREGVDRVLARTGAELLPGPGRVGLVVVGAELGLCGGYNRRVVDAGMARRAELGDGPTLAVGKRAALLLQRRGVAVTRSFPAATSVEGITRLLLSLAEEILTSWADQHLSAFDVVSARFGGVGDTPPEVRRLLPIDRPAPPGGTVLRYGDPDAIRAAAVRELLYISLYELLLDAVAAEHGARLAATQAAERWLDERTTEVHRRLVSARREAATQEVIEIAGGARARARARGRADGHVP